MKKKILAILIVLVIIMASGGIYFKSRSGAYDVNEEKKVIIDIPAGSSVDEISDILAEKKLIKNKIVFKINTKISGKASNFKAGKYKFDQSYTNQEIIDDIAIGRTYHSGPKVTIKEGATSKEIIDELVKKNLGSAETYNKLINNPDEFKNEFEFLKDENIKSLEGFLYPSTYYCEESNSEKEIITKMLNKFNEIYSLRIKKEVENKKLNFYDVMKMASIVEKEAVLDEDRPIIASVFYNRLEKGMPLQSDATIQYAFKERKKVVSYEDLKMESPYNSYKYKGLPPTPISNPSLKSIEAAINPAKTDYLYFVAKTDGGGNNYSKTYEEHLKYEKQYKDQREKQNKKSSETK